MNDIFYKLDKENGFLDGKFWEIIYQAYLATDMYFKLGFDCYIRNVIYWKIYWIIIKVHNAYRRYEVKSGSSINLN